MAFQEIIQHILEALKEKFEEAMEPLQSFLSPKKPSSLFEILRKKPYRVRTVDLNRLDSFEKLSLIGLDLEQLPEEIGLMTSLKELDLRNNQLRELPEALKNLKSLKVLDLRFNPLESIPEALQVLMARGVKIKVPDHIRIKPLSTKKLRNLANEMLVEGNSQERYVLTNGVICFTGRRLNNDLELDLSRKNIEDIKSIDGLLDLDDLIELSLTFNKITIIEGLEGLRNLKCLNLFSNHIETIYGLEKLINLRELSLGGNKIKKIEGLGALKNLKRLYLGHNYISKIEGLEPLTNLEGLHLSHNHISKIERLDNLKNLKIVNLNDNKKLTELEGLESLTNLRRLNLDNTYIQEIKGLDTLGNLRVLSLKKQRPECKAIQHVEGLEHLVKLEQFITTVPRKRFYIREKDVPTEIPTEVGRLYNEFRTDGRKWVNYCREQKNLEILPPRKKRS